MLELAAVAAVSWWGWETAGWWLSLAASLSVVYAWGTFVAPKAKVHLERPAWLAVQAVIFGAAALALASAASWWAGVAFAAVVVLNTATVVRG